MKNRNESAALFMMQATLGADRKTIDSVSKKGTKTWLNEQISTQLTQEELFLPHTKEIWSDFRQEFLRKYGESAINGMGNDPALPYWYYFRMAWWDKTLSDNTSHILRSRVAQALSEIIVISDKSNLQLDALGMADFYDILYKNAFGNYGDILEEVSLHPVMGVYLSHLNNRKEDKSKNIHPDENYAREIMQLFSIGLNELNMDGSEKIASNGKPIPTYTNEDIKELAKVFTGLKASEYEYEWNAVMKGYNGYKVAFNDGVAKKYKTIPFINMIKPMVCENVFHDKSAKNLLKGRVNVPKNQTAQEDIQKVVSDLLKHPNTAPFISKKMIQQLVTSNPSPEYVKDVASAFGKTGDMKKLVEAILLHPQAQKAKKLKSPFLRATQILRAFNVSNDSKKLWLTGDDIEYTLQQHILSSPTVFNFYLPDYVPHGEIESANLVAPEFQIHNSSTSIDYVNLMYDWLFGEYLPMASTKVHATRKNIPEVDNDRLAKNLDDRLKLDLSYEISLAKAKKYDELIEHLSLVLTGKQNVEFKDEIKDSFKNYKNESKWVVQTVIFMIVITPEFTVLKG